MNTTIYSSKYTKTSYRDYADYFALPFRCFRNKTKIKGLFKIDFEKVLYDKKRFYLKSEEIELLKIKKNSEENLFYQFFKKYESTTNLSTERKYEVTNNDFFDYLDDLHEVVQVARKRRYLVDFNEFLSILNNNCELAGKAIEEAKIDNYKSDININYSQKLKDLFVDKSLFDKIDFTKLKEYNVIYKKDCKALEFVEIRYRADVLLLIFCLEKNKLIKLQQGDEYLREVGLVLSDMNLSIDKSRVSRIKRAVETKKLYRKNKSNYADIELFISEIVKFE